MRLTQILLKVFCCVCSSAGGGNRALAPAQAVKMRVATHLLRTLPVEAQKRVQRAAVGRAQTPAVMTANQTILQVGLILMNHPAASWISCITLWLLVSPGLLILLPPTCLPSASYHLPHLSSSSI